MVDFKQLLKQAIGFFKKDTDGIVAYHKMVNFFFVQIFFIIVYLSSVLGYGIGSSGSSGFFLFLLGANAVMFSLGLLNWFIIKNFQSCHSPEYNNDNLLKIDIATSICIIPCYLVIKPIFFYNYKKNQKTQIKKSKKRKEEVLEDIPL